MTTLDLRFVALAIVFLLAGCGNSPSSPPAAQEPVAATSFSNLRPAAGQRETVQVQFFRGKKRLSGGHLSLTLTYGKHTLRSKGGTTNSRGVATASFTIPRVRKGTILHATTTVAYKGHRYMGSNQVTVVR